MTAGGRCMCVGRSLCRVALSCCFAFSCCRFRFFVFFSFLSCLLLGVGAVFFFLFFCVLWLCPRFVVCSATTNCLFAGVAFFCVDSPHLFVFFRWHTWKFEQSCHLGVLPLLPSPPCQSWRCCAGRVWSVLMLTAPLALTKHEWRATPSTLMASCRGVTKHNDRGRAMSSRNHNTGTLERSRITPPTGFVLFFVVSAVVLGALRVPRARLFVIVTHRLRE